MYGLAEEISTATWNVAGINNNPFEYWVTYPDPVYNQFMQAVEQLVGDADEDLTVNSIFTESMFLELLDEMRLQDIPNLDNVQELWTSDFSRRQAIQGFLKDKTIGDKRLASMPDRITNTINCTDGRTLRRPTVINSYCDSRLPSIHVWWGKWRQFLFRTHVQVFSQNSAKIQEQLVCSLIRPILRNKYPAITAYEQAMSVSLQILCLAILDAIFMHIVHRVAPETWEDIRSTLSNALIFGKDDRVCSIIADSYADTPVFFLQEATAALVRKLVQHTELSDRYALLMPADFDGKRDQNSVILLDRRQFDTAGCIDVTQQVLPLCRHAQRPAAPATSNHRIDGPRRPLSSVDLVVAQ
jgi:hypothetical protein